MATIDIKIDRTGNVTMEVSGMKGLGCEELTKVFEEALGTRTSIDFKEEDFVVLDGQQQHVHEGNGE
jgi:DUF2997 family protein